MTNKSHLINFCYLPYLHLKFPTGTITFLLDFTRLKTLSLFYAFICLLILNYITPPFALIAKKSYQKQKRP